MPEIIEGIFKSMIVGHIKTNTENDLILRESIRFAKTYGKKYKLIPCKKIDYRHITSEDRKVKKLYRIKALKSFSDVKKGDIGGIIDKSSVLSHAGNCWIYDDAIVMNESYVTDDAEIRDRATVNCSFIRNKSKILYESTISNSIIRDSSIITKYSEIISSKISGESKIDDFSSIIDSVCESVHTDMNVSFMQCIVSTSKKISGIIDLTNCYILKNASIKGFFTATNCIFTDDTDIDLHDDINEKCSHIIGLNAKICSDKDFITVHGFGTDKLPITFFKCSDNKIRCIINNDFSGDFSETREYLLKNGGEEYDGEFDSVIKYVEKKLNFDEDKNRN